MKEKIKAKLETLTKRQIIFIIIFLMILSFCFVDLASEYRQKGTIEMETLLKWLDSIVTWVVKLVIFI